jgi:hypothetical protein
MEDLGVVVDARLQLKRKSVAVVRKSHLDRRLGRRRRRRRIGGRRWGITRTRRDRLVEKGHSGVGRPNNSRAGRRLRRGWLHERIR